MEVTNLHGPVNPLHTHQMHMCSQQQVNALALIIFYDRLNNIIKQTYCCVLPKTNKQKKKLSLKINGIKVAKRVTSSFGDPYKYAEYLEADHSSPQQQVPNIPFKDILGDDYFDDTNVSDGGGDSQGSDGEHQDFEFEDIVPFLEEEDNGDATLRHPAAGEEEGEIRPPVPAPRRATQIDSPPIRGFETPPHQRRGRLSTPIRRLPQEPEGEEEGAVGGEERTATFEEQSAYYSALLDKIEIYTDEAELAQRSFPDLDPASQQQLQAEIRQRARELQKELDWAEKALAPQVITKVIFSRLQHQVTPRAPPVR